MKRFILLSFGFLGWAFYEMSGGAEFESRSDRLARLIPAPEVQVVDGTPTRADETQVAQTGIVDTDPPLRDADDTVTRVSLNLTSLQDVLNIEEVDEGAATTASLTEDLTEGDSGVPQNIGSVTSSVDTPAIIPSLIDPTDGVTTALNEALGDIRIVSGNRVNVRGGPGTDYGVVTKLSEGAQVRVVLDNGDGWVKMQPLDGSPEGWMADFLLTSG